MKSGDPSPPSSEVNQTFSTTFLFWTIFSFSFNFQLVVKTFKDFLKVFLESKECCCQHNMKTSFRQY